MLKIVLHIIISVFELHFNQQSLVSLLWSKATGCLDMIFNVNAACRWHSNRIVYYRDLHLYRDTFSLLNLNVDNQRWCQTKTKARTFYKCADILVVYPAQPKVCLTRHCPMNSVYKPNILQRSSSEKIKHSFLDWNVCAGIKGFWIRGWWSVFSICFITLKLMPG